MDEGRRLHGEAGVCCVCTAVGGIGLEQGVCDAVEVPSLRASVRAVGRPFPTQRLSVI